MLMGVVHCKFSSLQTGKVRKIFMNRCLFRGGCFWKALCEGVCTCTTRTTQRTNDYTRHTGINIYTHQPIVHVYSSLSLSLFLSFSLSPTHTLAHNGFFLWLGQFCSSRQVRSVVGVRGRKKGTAQTWLNRTASQRHNSTAIERPSRPRIQPPWYANSTRPGRGQAWAANRSCGCFQQYSL